MPKEPLVDLEWITIRVGAVPSYAIDEEEALDLLLEVGGPSKCANISDAFPHISSDSRSGLLRIATVVVIPAPNDLSAAADAATGVAVGSAVVGVLIGGGLPAEQQALSAMAMLTCADPHTRAAFGSYRALSPFAVWDSYLGVVVGNFIFVSAVLCVQGAVLLGLRLAKRVRRWEELSAIARFPALLLQGTFAVHMGTAYAASQLITLADRPAEDRVVGAVAFAFVVLYPFGLVGFAHKFVGRAFQSYAIGEFLGEKQWPFWVAHVLPQGAIYAPETRKTFGALVSAYRLSGPHWPSYPTWTPMIFAIGGLFHPDTIPKCQALFGCMAAAFVCAAIAAAWCQPKRTTA